jgi:hypothetical protein
MNAMFGLHRHCRIGHGNDRSVSIPSCPGSTRASMDRRVQPGDDGQRFRRRCRIPLEAIAS